MLYHSVATAKGVIIILLEMAPMIREISDMSSIGFMYSGHLISSYESSKIPVDTTIGITGITELFSSLQIRSGDNLFGIGQNLAHP